MASGEQYRVIRERNVMVPMRDGVRLATTSTAPTRRAASRRW